MNHTLALLALLLVSAAPPDLGVTLPGRVVNVVDGDTLDVAVTMVVRVRLLDCWAPESRTKDAAEKQRGLAAKAALKALADGKPCRVSIPLTGDLKQSLTLERVLARVWIDGDKVDLSEHQVKAGHATKEKP